MGEFDGQVAVITGGARGIGAEIARRLSAGGAHVVCADVLDTDEIVTEIGAPGGSAEGRSVDVTDAVKPGALDQITIRVRATNEAWGCSGVYERMFLYAPTE